MRLFFACALLAGLLFAAPAAQSQSSTALFLYVNFFANGDIAVTLPDGTPVGVTSGSPTVIPAGFYTVQMTGPGGCTNLPYFNLKGPGNNIIDSMDQGEEANKNVNANFLPNSTYTWWNAQNPGQVFTFVTNGQVLGTAPDCSRFGQARHRDDHRSARLRAGDDPRHPHGSGQRSREAQLRVQGEERREPAVGQVQVRDQRQELEHRLPGAEGLAHADPRQRHQVRRQAHEMGRPDRRQVELPAACGQACLHRHGEGRHLLAQQEISPGPPQPRPGQPPR